MSSFDTRNILLLAVVCVASSEGSGASISVSLEKRIVRDTSFSVVVHKEAYFGTVSLGSPAQELTVVFDTGSGNLIVPGANCRSPACRAHKRYNQNVSTSAQKMNCDGTFLQWDEPADALTIQFATGKITGRCLTDLICVNNVCTTGAFLASTDETSEPFVGLQFDGVLGLALPSMAHSQNFHMMQRLASVSALKRSLFAVFLSASDEETSEFTFGDIKSEHMASDLFWVPITGSAGYWEVKIDDITLNGKQQAVCQDCRVAVDTGTSELAGPSDIMDKLRDLLDVKSDCRNYAGLPKLGFIVGGRILNLDPSDYVERNDGERCELSLMDLDVPPPKGPIFVFGIPFLQKYYTVYDHDNRRVGFAVAKHEGETPESLVEMEWEDPSSESTSWSRPKKLSFLARRNGTYRSRAFDSS